MRALLLGFASSVAIIAATSSGFADEEVNTAVEETEITSAQALTDQNRDLIQQEIKNYLDNNPEFIRDFLFENPGVIIEAINLYQQQEEQAKVAASQAVLTERKEELLSDGYSFVGGNPDGDITLVEFLDYRCHFCKKAHDEVDALLENDGNIRLVVKQFPVLGPESVYASAAATAAMKQDDGKKFLTFHNNMMKYHGNLTNDAVIKIAKDSGLDIEQLNADMNDLDTKAVIDKNHQLAADLQLTGTPGFVLGNEIIRGYVTADVFARIVEQERQTQ